MARPSKFTAERRDRFKTAYRTGVYPETAARFAGWSPATLYRILRGTTPAHVAFRDEILQIETELEIRLAGTVTQAAFADPRLALSLLERRFRDRWGHRAEPGPIADGVGRRSRPDIVIEPALIEAVVPVLLAERLGPGATPDALQRVSRFSRTLTDGDGEA